MRELSQDECIEIRKDILHAFHEMCEDKAIKYALGYGSLLGAVRHGGMIPWDDDIDVLVLRADFERLCELYAARDCRDRYQFVSHRNHPEIKTKIGYFIDFNTVTEMGGTTNEYHGIHIDIYPVDVVPKGALAKMILLTKRWFLHDLIRAKNLHPHLVRGFPRLIRQLILTGCTPFSYDAVLERLHTVSMKYKDIPETEKKEACVFVEEGRAHIFPYSITQEYALYDYDGHRYWSYRCYDPILRAWYGDYMTPPPVSERNMPDHGNMHFYYKDGIK